MPRFAYSAYADTGLLLKGELEADNGTDALSILAARGLTPAAISENALAIPWWSRDVSFRRSGLHVRRQELSQFFSNLAAMLNAHFPLLKALEFCGGQTRDKTMKRSLDMLRGAVENGRQLHQAMRQAEGVFPTYIVALIELGENSNSLATIVKRIDTMLLDQTAMQRELRSTLIYPAILLVVGLFVMSLIIFYLVPTLLPVFSSAGATVPLALQFMSYVHDAVLDGWPVLVSGFLGFTILIAVWGRGLLDACAPILRRLPLIGPYNQRSETLRICQTLTLMLGCGANLAQALATCRQTCQTSAYITLAERAERAVTDGGRMSDVTSNNDLVDPMVAALIEAAEETDRLGEVFETIVADLSVKLRQTLKQSIQLITPVLTLLIGIVVGAVILSTITAIMDINDLAI